MTAPSSLIEFEKRRHKLTEISVEEVSLVDKPANPGARVLVYKNERPGDTDAVVSAEADLEILAQAHAEKHNVSIAKAYDAVLRSPEGAALYTKSLEEPRRFPVQKRDPVVPSDSIDEHYRAIAKRIRREGETEAQAYVRALKECPEAYNVGYLQDAYTRR